MTIYNQSQHPENPAATKAFELLKKGQEGAAATVLANAGYTDIAWQIDTMLGFIAKMKTPKRREHGLLHKPVRPVWTRTRR